MKKITLSIASKDFDITLDEAFAEYFKQDLQRTFHGKNNIDIKDILNAYLQKCHDEFLAKEKILQTLNKLKSHDT